MAARPSFKKNNRAYFLPEDIKGVCWKQLQLKHIHAALNVHNVLSSKLVQGINVTNLHNIEITGVLDLYWWLYKILICQEVTILR